MNRQTAHISCLCDTTVALLSIAEVKVKTSEQNWAEIKSITFLFVLFGEIKSITFLFVLFGEIKSITFLFVLFGEIKSITFLFICLIRCTCPDQHNIQEQRDDAQRRNRNDREVYAVNAVNAT